MRPRLYKDYSTTTLKLEHNTLRRFMRMLDGKSRNSYMVKKVVELREFFENSTQEEKMKLVLDLMPYASRRKIAGTDVEIDKRKDCVVSLKCEKCDYEVVVREAGKLGLSFSEIMRRLIIRDIEATLKD